MSDDVLVLALAEERVDELVAQSEERLSASFGAALKTYRDRVNEWLDTIPAIVETAAEGAASRHPGPPGEPGVKGEMGVQPADWDGIRRAVDALSKQLTRLEQRKVKLTITRDAQGRISGLVQQ